jgi:hypothetical protein
MLWKILGTIGAFTFLGGGVDIATTDRCTSVVFGGGGRSYTYECTYGQVKGDMGAGAASALMILGSLGVLALIWGPAIARALGAGAGRHDTGVSFRSPSQGSSRVTGDYITFHQAASANPAASANQAPSASTGTGWYPDPFGRFQVRYRDGERWTSHVATGGRIYEDDPSP